MAVGPFPTRTLGVLLHPSSLPGPELIGTLGSAATTFVDWLAGTGAGIWQILPLTINGKDDSPYFSSSAFAGNHLLIDLASLAEQGLLTRDEVASAVSDHDIDDRVAFAELRRRKMPLLERAADRLLADPSWADGYAAFVGAASWLQDACLFFALHDVHGGEPWWTWPEEIRRHEPAAVAAARAELSDRIGRWQAIQYLFEMQWRSVRDAARDRGLRVFGDLPIYVAPDSADVWAHQRLFALDTDGSLLAQSGCPPDYFSERGQLWGNPLYRWDVMGEDGYAWWIERLRRCLELTDLVRIDHFRALAAYWEIDGDTDDATTGRWKPGPGQDFLDAVRAAFPDFPFVAEDLGTLDDGVYELRDHNDLPGMRIIQFGFDGTPDNPHLPGAYPEACIAYTGTHDNEPIAAWWTSLDQGTRAAVGDYYRHGGDADIGRAVWSFIEAAIASRAIAAVIPMQDLLVLDRRARMNDPSTTVGNWGWRMPTTALSPDLAQSLRSLGERYGRINAT